MILGTNIWSASRSRGIDLEGVQKDESGPTFFWKGKYHENFNRRDTLDIQLNVFEKIQTRPPGFIQKYSICTS